MEECKNNITEEQQVIHDTLIDTEDDGFKMAKFHEKRNSQPDYLADVQVQLT